MRYSSSSPSMTYEKDVLRGAHLPPPAGRPPGRAMSCAVWRNMYVGVNVLSTCSPPFLLLLRLDLLRAAAAEKTPADHKPAVPVHPPTPLAHFLDERPRNTRFAVRRLPTQFLPPGYMAASYHHTTPQGRRATTPRRRRCRAFQSWFGRLRWMSSRLAR